MLLGIDPGITKANPCGIAIFAEGRLVQWYLIIPFPLSGGPGARAMAIIERLDYLREAKGITEIACEEIVPWPGHRNLEGLVVLAREIKALAERRKLPINFYTPQQWHGRLKAPVWQAAIIQEWGLPEDTSVHILAAVGIGAYHLAREAKAIKGTVMPHKKRPDLVIGE